ncbi:MAG: hypothetical protein ABEI57_05455 [Halapricum sp.]
MRRVLVALAFASMLVLAGCTGGGGGTTAAPSTTPQTPTAVATTQQGPTNASSIPESAYPPGTSADGVTNASKLLAAHNDALLRTDFATQENTSIDRLAANGTAQSAQRSLLRVDMDTEQATVDLLSITNTTAGKQVRRTTAFTNGSIVATRTTQNNQTNYQVRQAQSFRAMVTNGPRVGGLLSGASFTPVASAQRGNRTLIRFDVTGLNESALPANRSVRKVGGSLVVDDRGLIRSLSIRYQITNSDGVPLLARTYSLSVTPTSLDVSRPDWLQTAIDRSG